MRLALRCALWFSLLFSNGAVWNSTRVIAQTPPTCSENSPVRLAAPWRANDVFVVGSGGGGSWHFQGGHTVANNAQCDVDFNAAGGRDDDGVPILAAADGRVEQAGKSAYGYSVILDHSDLSPDVKTLYGHLKYDPKKNPGLREGQFVRRGNVIGFLGTTGTSSGAHLHFGLRRARRQSINFDRLDDQVLNDRSEITSRNRILAADDALFPDGTLIKPENITHSRNVNGFGAGYATIFYVENGRLRPFISDDHYRSWLYDNAHFAIAVSDATLERYYAMGLGAPMSFRPGTLIRSRDQDKPTVYAVVYRNGSTTRYGLSAEEFRRLGYHDTNIMVVDNYLVDALHNTPADSRVGIAGIVEPNISIVNVTDPTRNPVFWTGDRWKLDVTNAPPNSSVYIRVSKDGQYLGTSGPYGSKTDTAGRWSLPGEFTNSSLGAWQEQAVLGGLDSSVVSSILSITVSDPPPTLPLTVSCSAVPVMVEPNDALSFEAQARGGKAPLRYSWSDAITGTSSVVNASFGLAGTYRATVLVTDSSVPAQALAATCVANIVEVGTLNFDVVTEQVPPYYVGTNITFKTKVATGKPPFKYEWSGDVSGTTPEVTKAFSTPGEYTAACTITDDRGQVLSRSNKITVVSRPSSTGKINVNAIFKNTKWSGDLSFRVRGKDSASKFDYTYTTVPQTIDAPAPDDYVVEYLAGGPAHSSRNFGNPQIKELSAGGQAYFDFTFNPLASQIVIIDGDGQLGEAGTDLSKPLVVEAQDQAGSPVAGIPITFSVTSGGGTVSPATVQSSGTDGRVKANATFGRVAGLHRFSATSAGLPSVIFSATATLTASKVQSVSGNNQSGPPGTALPQPLKVKVTNLGNVPVPGITVMWTAVSGGGTVSSATTITDSVGETQVNATLGRSGSNTYSASVAGLSSAIFTATTSDSPTILFSDNFDRAGPGLGEDWITDTCNGGRVEIDGGRRLKLDSRGITCPNHRVAAIVNRQLDDVIIEFDLNATLLDGQNNLAFVYARYTDIVNTYAVTIQRAQGRQVVEINGPSGVLDRKTGIDLVPGRYRFSVVGHELAFTNVSGGTSISLSATDSRLATGGIGFGSNEAVVYIDNLVVRRP